jgi:hypothetical protein
VLLVAALCAGVFLWSPHRAADELWHALRSGDRAALAERVDLEALKQSMKEELFRLWTAAAPNKDAAMAASGFVDGMVEASISEDKLAQLGGAPRAEPDWALSWRGPSLVELRPADEDAATFLLERRGLSWRWTGLELPESSATKLTAAVQAMGSPPTPVYEVDELKNRACRGNQGSARVNLKALWIRQQAHQAEHGRYSDDLQALDFAVSGNPDLYDFSIRRAGPKTFVAEAQGVGIMKGDRWTIDETSEVAHPDNLCPAP